jgi:hypothetical protein
VIGSLGLTPSVTTRIQRGRTCCCMQALSSMRRSLLSRLRASSRSRPPVDASSTSAPSSSTAVKVIDVAAGHEVARRGGHFDERLHRLATDRRANRGAAGLSWDRLDLDGDPPTIQVWRSVRRDGRMKTARSRRTLELPDRCVEALRDHKAEQVKMRHQAGDSSVELGLVFCTGTGRPSTPQRPAFVPPGREPGRARPQKWAARVTAQFRVLASSSGVTIEEIAHLVGPGSTERPV